MDGAVDEDVRQRIGHRRRRSRTGSSLSQVWERKTAGRPNQPGEHFRAGVTVGGVEAAGEVADDFLAGVLLLSFTVGGADKLGS